MTMVAIPERMPAQCTPRPSAPSSGPIDLMSEYLTAVERFERQHANALPALEELGIEPANLSLRLAAPYWPVGIARISVFGDGTYEPDPSGTPYYLTPVAYGDPEGFDQGDFDVTDLVAWRPSISGFWQREGTSPLLGPDAALQARRNNEPLDVCYGPLAWLQAGCVGVGVVNWDRLWPSDLSSIVICRETRSAAQIRDICRQCGTHDIEIRVRSNDANL